jgi:hypothetical protein
VIGLGVVLGAVAVETISAEVTIAGARCRLLGLHLYRKATLAVMGS